MFFSHSLFLSSFVSFPSWSPFLRSIFLHLVRERVPAGEDGSLPVALPLLPSFPLCLLLPGSVLPAARRVNQEMKTLRSPPGGKATSVDRRATVGLISGCSELLRLSFSFFRRTFLSNLRSRRKRVKKKKKKGKRVWTRPEDRPMMSLT